MFLRSPEPIYNIIKEPADGHPNFLIAEIRLPKVVSETSLLWLNLFTLMSFDFIHKENGSNT